MAKSPQKRRSSNTKNTSVAVLLLFVIVCGFVATLVWRGDLDLISFFGGGNAGSNGYKNVTLTDAAMECQNFAQEKFGKRLRFITLDRHSSRYDERSNRFKMYYRLDLYGRNSSSGETTEFFLNCFVHASRGSITHFESVENKQEQPGARRQSDGGFFGL
ncbi:hypothetical protein NBRC116494_03500 [Aurantivibrio plasticivorans]